MARRRKKYRKRLLMRQPLRPPDRFDCPNCGAKALTVTIDRKDVDDEGKVKAIIRCSKCGLYAEMRVPKIYEAVDVYSKFLDGFLEGTIEYTFTKPQGGEGTLKLDELVGEGESSSGEEPGKSREEVEE